jgi:GntR family transcriptional regulator
MAVPMWRQIADDLRAKIESGELGGDGVPLPTELELRDRYGASRATVRDSVKWLAARGLVYTRSGRGTFVARKVDPFLTRITGEPEPGMEESTAFAVAVRSESRIPTVSVPQVEIHQAVGLAARELRLPDGTAVISRQQRRFIDGVPYSLQTTFYPMSLLDRGATRLLLAENIPEGAVAYIESVLGIRQAGARDRLVARVPDDQEAMFFGLPDDGRVVILEIIRTGFDEAGRPLRVTITTYPADRNQFVLEHGKLPASE